MDIKKSIFGFVLLEAVIYVLFLYQDFHGNDAVLSTGLKFSGILICFLFLLSAYIFRSRQERGSEFLLMVIALAFTVCADICLLLTNHFEFGVFFFLLVQFLYLFRLKKSIASVLWIVLLRLLTASILILLVKMAGLAVDGLLVLSIFYFLNILHNTGMSMKAARNNRIGKDDSKITAELFMAGMILFLLCDINVGIFNIGGYIAAYHVILSTLIDFSSSAMWLFYLPSQVLIVISAVSPWHGSH